MVTKTKGATRGQRQVSKEEFRARCFAVRTAFYSRIPEPRRHTPREIQDDTHAAIDIAFTQCFGDEAKARHLVAEMFEAAGGKLPGDSLHERYLHYCHWYETGLPATPRPMSRSKKTQLRQFVLENAAGELNRATGATAGAA